MHVAIIMDGNGRWANRQGLPRVFGHRKGVLRVEDCVRACPDLGIKTLTLYAFSTENWKRPQHEVSTIFRLMHVYFRRKALELRKEQVCVRFIGKRNRLAAVVRETMEYVEKLTANCQRLVLNIAVDYGGRDEIVRAAQTLVDEARKAPEKELVVDEATFAAATDLAGLKEPDLVIRTGGDHRISNFMLWHIAYSELEFCSETWPEFSVDILERIVIGFRARQRRFGGLQAATGA